MCLCVYCRSLALGTKTGYKLFSLTMVEKLDCIHESGQYEALTLYFASVWAKYQFIFSGELHLSVKIIKHILLISLANWLII